MKTYQNGYLHQLKQQTIEKKTFRIFMERLFDDIIKRESMLKPPKIYESHPP